MSQVEVPAVERVPMSYDEWWALPDKPKSEWVDGVVVIVNVPPNFDHSDGTLGLAGRFRRAFPDLKVYADAPLRLPRNRVRRPDLMVLRQRPEGKVATEVPILVVEILSPGTHTVDLFDKAPEYAEAGVGQFWIVDPEARTLEVYELVDGRWEPLIQLDRLRPSGEVKVGDLATVSVDLRSIFED